MQNHDLLPSLDTQDTAPIWQIQIVQTPEDIDYSGLLGGNNFLTG